MASPRRITPATLKSWIDTEAASIAIVDVRDGDYFGGHIRSSLNVPSASFFSKVADLVTRLGKANKVIFHCQLSQQRGPSCAKLYNRQLLLKGNNKQEVYVLKGGFSDWARLYGRDSKYTEGYIPELHE